MSTLAVYPGSFDPLTNGHVDIISRGARLFDRIIVAILVNAEKSPLFTMEERVEIARTVFKDHPNVEVDTFDGLLVDYVARRKAQRDRPRACAPISDFEFEFQMALMNRRLNAQDRNRVHDAGRAVHLHQLASDQGGLRARRTASTASCRSMVEERLREKVAAQPRR